MTRHLNGLLRTVITPILLLFLIAPAASAQQKSFNELVASMKYDRPARTGEQNLDDMYECAAKFHSEIEHIADSVPMFHVAKRLNADGDTVIVVVDSEGNPRNALKIASQVVKALGFMTRTASYTTSLTSYLASNSVQIGIDAGAGLLGGKAAKSRVKANKQIVNMTKVYPLIFNKVKEQSNLIKAYREAHEQHSADSGPITTLPGFDITDETDLEALTPEELEALGL